ncbi:MAG: urea carboxylase, partial [Acidiphilium sp. 37-67-22]
MEHHFDAAILDVVVPARAPFSATLKAGQVLRIIDLESQQAVDALFYNAADPGERYSAQDTLAAQARA